MHFQHSFSLTNCWVEEKAHKQRRKVWKRPWSRPCFHLADYSFGKPFFVLQQIFLCHIYLGLSGGKKTRFFQIKDLNCYLLQKIFQMFWSVLTFFVFSKSRSSCFVFVVLLLWNGNVQTSGDPAEAWILNTSHTPAVKRGDKEGNKHTEPGRERHTRRVLHKDGVQRGTLLRGFQEILLSQLVFPPVCFFCFSAIRLANWLSRIDVTGKFSYWTQAKHFIDSLRLKRMFFWCVSYMILWHFLTMEDLCKENKCLTRLDKGPTFWRIAQPGNRTQVSCVPVLYPAKKLIKSLQGGFMKRPLGKFLH